MKLQALQASLAVAICENIKDGQRRFIGARIHRACESHVMTEMLRFAAQYPSLKWVFRIAEEPNDLRALTISVHNPPPMPVYSHRPDGFGGWAMTRLQ